MKNSLYDLLHEHDMIPEIDTVIKADNVARYYAEVQKWNEGKPLDLVDDLPNIAPPFSGFMVEWKPPYDLVKMHTPTMQRMDGVFLFSIETDKNIDVIDNIPLSNNFLREYLSSGKWLTGADIYQEGSRGGLHHLGRCALAIDEDGKYIKPKAENGMIYWMGDVIKRFDREAAINYLISSVEIALMTVSFLHCKNVDLYRPDVQKLPMTKKRLHQIPRIRFYTLNVKPMQKILKEEGNEEHTGLKLALHICRGHFKDFSKGDGLFGRHKGLYWWHQHVRGNLSSGAVVKDYKVNPPELGA